MTDPGTLTRLIVSGLLVGVWFLAPAPASADALPDDVGTLLECVKANLPKHSSVQTVEFRSLDRVGNERKIKARIYWQRFDDGLTKLRLKVSEPPDLRGTALLLIEKKDGVDMFIYLPDLERVKRVTSRMLSGSLFGSDFSYEDFMQLQGIGSGGRHELRDASSEPANNSANDPPVVDASLQVVVHHPGPESGSSYTRVVSYWDRESCTLVRSEMWESGERPRKILEVDPTAVFSSKGARIPGKLVMTDVRDQTSTHLSIDEIEIDVKIPRKIFSASALGRN